MPTATPSVEDVVDAIATRISAVLSSPAPSVVKRFHPLEDDIEEIEVQSYIASGSMDLWIIDLAAAEPFEGPGSGEDYDRYHIRIRYWSIRTNDADWGKTARTRLQSVVSDLTANSSVFAVSGQRQLHTPELCEVEKGPEQTEIRGTEGPQMVYEAVLRLLVEARRWS